MYETRSIVSSRVEYVSLFGNSDPLFPGTGPDLDFPVYFDGFVVIEAKGTKHRPPLVVNAHHWLIGLIAGTSRQIVQVKPVAVDDKFELCPIEEGDDEVEGCVSPPEP